MGQSFADFADKELQKKSVKPTSFAAFADSQLKSAPSKYKVDQVSPYTLGEGILDTLQGASDTAQRAKVAIPEAIVKTATGLPMGLLGTAIGAAATVPKLGRWGVGQIMGEVPPKFNFDKEFEFGQKITGGNAQPSTKMGRDIVGAVGEVMGAIDKPIEANVNDLTKALFPESQAGQKLTGEIGNFIMKTLFWGSAFKIMKGQPVTGADLKAGLKGADLSPEAWKKIEGLRDEVKITPVKTKEPTTTGLPKVIVERPVADANVPAAPDGIPVVRMGDISESGAYFSDKGGGSTYSDSAATGVGKEYVISKGAKIADTTKVDIADALIRETLNDARLNPKERARLESAIGEGNIDYLLFDETPMAEASRRLGYDGVRVVEMDDIPGSASSIFVNDVSKITPSKTRGVSATKSLSSAVGEMVAPERLPGQKPSGLALDARVRAAEKKLIDSGDAGVIGYDPITHKAHIAKSIEILGDRVRADKIISGSEKLPGDVLPSIFAKIAEREALASSDAPRLMALSQSPLSVEVSTAAQTLGGARVGLGALDSPVKVMKDVMDIRAEKIEKRTGTRPKPGMDEARLSELQAKLDAAEKALASKESPKIKAEKVTYGSRNKFVTTAEYLVTQAEIRKLFSAQVGFGADPAIAAKLVKVGAYHLEAGTRSAAAWSSKMIAEYGDKVKPYLDDVWKQINDNKALKSRLVNKAEAYEDRLLRRDFAGKEKRPRSKDPEVIKLRERADQAYKNWKSAKDAVGLLSKEEAENITALSGVMAKAKETAEGTNWDRKSALEYGAARRTYVKYVNKLKEGDTSLKGIAKARWEEARLMWRFNRAKAVSNVISDEVKNLSNASVALVASVDNSFIGRQGLTTLMTHPTVWGKMAKQSFVDMFNAIAKKNGAEMAEDSFWADVYSKENYRNGNYESNKFLPKSEEQFPTSLPSRIPVLGKVFKASEIAFELSAMRSRMDLFDLFYRQAKESGVNVADQYWVGNMGKLVNSMTARGDLGRWGEGGVIRLAMWAPKMLKGNIDILTAHGLGRQFEGAKWSPEFKFAQKQAQMNLVKIAAETGFVAAVINAIRPGSVEVDPRSSDFMKAKIGNTRFDLTGGKGSIVTLAARLLAGRTKSTTTGLVQKLDTGKYGEPTRLSIGLDFLYNKTPPVTRAAIDIAKGKDRAGNKPTIGSTAFSLATPISIQNFVKNFYGPDKDGSAAAVVGSLVDFVGIGSNTYDPFSQMTKPKTPEEIADMSRSQRRKYGRDKDKPGFVRMVEGMSLDEALDVYAKADAEKRASILGSIRMKINTTMRRKDMAPKRRAELLKKIDEFRRSMGGENK